MIFKSIVVLSLPYYRSVQYWSQGATVLQSLALTLIKHTWTSSTRSSGSLETSSMVYWSRLELKSAGCWPSRSRIGDPCLCVYSSYAPSAKPFQCIALGIAEPPRKKYNWDQYILTWTLWFNTTVKNIGAVVLKSWQTEEILTNQGTNWSTD